MRFAVISDTHGLIRPQVREIASGCDMILHAGDLGTQKVCESLAGLKELAAVRGNADGSLPDSIPELIVRETAGILIVICHKKKDLKGAAEAIEARKKEGLPCLIVTGHTHRYEEKREGSLFWLNPGCCGPVRGKKEATMAIVTADGGEISAEKIVLEQGIRLGALEVAENPLPLISAVMRETEKGRPVPEAAARTGLSEDITDRIVRMMMTHPGVTPEGIASRLGL